jgi:hypothetical protein
MTSVPILGATTPGDTPPQEMVQLGVAVQQQPNGKHMVVVNFGGKLFSFSLAFPPDAAENLGAKLPKLFRDAAAHARRADTGLITAAPTGGITQ